MCKSLCLPEATPLLSSRLPAPPRAVTAGISTPTRMPKAMRTRSRCRQHLNSPPPVAHGDGNCCLAELIRLDFPFFDIFAASDSNRMSESDAEKDAQRSQSTTTLPPAIPSAAEYSCAAATLDPARLTPRHHLHQLRQQHRR